MKVTSTATTQVHHVRWITDSVYVLRFDRRGLSFSPGQYLVVGPVGSIEMREYSVYSAGEDYLEILVKVVEGGSVSQFLSRLEPGDPVHVDGPFGYFTVDEDWRDHRFFFIATGTGISPFHMFASAYGDMDYTLIHGTRYAREDFDLGWYRKERVVRCVSREGGGPERGGPGRGGPGRGGRFHGRVTDYLKGLPVDVGARYYLCGNCDMIYEVFDILQDRGVSHSHIFAEVYF